MPARRPITIANPAPTDRRAATRAGVLDAARSMLASGESMAAMTVGAVASAAGVSRATFYLHFDGKRGLIDELIAEAFASWDELSAPMLGTAPDRKVLAAVVDSIVATWVANAAVLSALIEIAEYDPETAAAWSARIDDIAGTVEQWLVATRTDLAADRRRAVSHVIAWGTERSLHRMLTDEPSDQHEVGAALTEVVWSVATGGPSEHDPE